MMAERIVDILEMVEIDIEDGSRRAAVSHLLNHRFQPLAEEYAIGQAAKRVVHREMAEPGFTRGDGRCGTPSTGPTATAAMTAGRPISRRITAAWGFEPPSVRLNWLSRMALCKAGVRPRI